MIKNSKISDYEIIKGCAEYLQISEAEIISDDYMQEHPDVLDILVNVAISCKKKPFREELIYHRKSVAHSLCCTNIDTFTRYKAEERTRDKMLKDKTFRRLIKEVGKFISQKDYSTGDFEVVDSKIVGYHGKEKDVVIPAGLLLGKYAFSKCDIIETVTLNKQIKDIPLNAFSMCKNLTKIYGLEQVEKIESNAFFCCESLSEIELPIGIKEIDDHTFYGCTSLKEISIPASVIEIGYAAFQDCKNLKSVKFSKGLKEIHTEAFMCCDSLEEVEIPDSVEKIGDAAFEFCKNLKRVSLPSQVLVGRNAFSYTPWEAEQARGRAFITNGILHKVDEKIKEYVIPEDITLIAKGAFYKSNIRKLTIPKNVRHISEFAFSNSQLEKTHFECEECELADCLFDHCENIKEIILPANMKRIYEHTFSNVNAIVEIPEFVESIDRNAFSLSPLSKPTDMKPKIRAKEGSIGAEFAKKHGIELILK